MESRVWKSILFAVKEEHAALNCGCFFLIFSQISHPNVRAIGRSHGSVGCLAIATSATGIRCVFNVFSATMATSWMRVSEKSWKRASVKSLLHCVRICLYLRRVAMIPHDTDHQIFGACVNFVGVREG